MVDGTFFPSCTHFLFCDKDDNPFVGTVWKHATQKNGISGYDVLCFEKNGKYLDYFEDTNGVIREYANEEEQSLRSYGVDTDNKLLVLYVRDAPLLEYVYEGNSPHSLYFLGGGNIKKLAYTRQQ